MKYYCGIKLCKLYQIEKGKLILFMIPKALCLHCLHENTFGCVILPKVPSFSGLPPLSSGILGKLSDLSELAHLSCVILGRLPDLSMRHLMSLVILGKLPNFSVIPLLICVIIGKLQYLCFSTSVLCDLRQVA